MQTSVEPGLKNLRKMVCCAALEALIETWQDESIRQLLAERAGIEGFAASQVGGQHSPFGRIVFEETPYMPGLYLDPTQPISREHIEGAAERANIPAEKIDETVRSLSEHMGWDIEQGAAG